MQSLLTHCTERVRGLSVNAEFTHSLYRGSQGIVCECRVYITHCTEGVRGLSVNVEFTSLTVQRE